jgi:hypothetical protein
MNLATQREPDADCDCRYARVNSGPWPNDGNPFDLGGFDREKHWRGSVGRARVTAASRGSRRVFYSRKRAVRTNLDFEGITSNGRLQ